MIIVRVYNVIYIVIPEYCGNLNHGMFTETMLMKKASVSRKKKKEKKIVDL